MYCPESCRPTPVRVKTPLSTVCFHGNGARSLDQVMTGGGEPGENKQTKEDKTKVTAWETPSFASSGDDLTAGLARHCDGVSLHHRHLCGADRSHRCSRAALHKEFNFDLRYPFAVFCLADINARVFRMDHGPLGKEGHRFLLHPTQAWRAP